jgi:hypothetical protein
MLGELVQTHLGNRELGNVFPGFSPKSFRGLIRT